MGIGGGDVLGIDTTSDTSNLIEDNMALVGHVIDKYYSYLLNYWEYDDLFQIGCIGLIQAAEKYQGELQKYKFSTVAVNYIRSALTKLATRHLYSKKRGPSFHERSLSEPTTDNLTLGDLFGVDCFAEADNRLTLEHLFKRLSERERAVLKLRLEGYKQVEIGKALGVSQTYIGTMERKAIKKMRRAI